MELKTQIYISREVNMFSDLDAKELIEAPRRKQRGIFDRKEVCHFWIRSLTPPQAAGNALTFAIQELKSISKILQSLHGSLNKL
ncbi:MAG: hypothetical protein Q7J15_01110 [Candidatus Desulfaltia sp.]|nr:hypothetical protein [Candidatus Desulfaltia sp.]